MLQRVQIAAVRLLVFTLVAGLLPISHVAVRAENVMNDNKHPLGNSVMAEPLLDQAPLIAKYEMEPNATDPFALTDESGNKQDGAFKAPAALIPGRPGAGQALYLNGADQANVSDKKLNRMNRIYSELTVTAWIKPDDLNGPQPIVTKRDASWKGMTFYVGLMDNKLYFSSNYGEDAFTWSYASPDIVAGQWFHVAVAFEKHAGARFYVNGKLIGSVDGNMVVAGLLPNDVTMLLGTEWHFDSAAQKMLKYGYRGAIDSLRMYASALTEQQVEADQNNTLPTRTAQDADFAPPMKYGLLRLVRFDSPTGRFVKGNAQIHRLAERKDGPDAVDWPELTLSIMEPDGTVRSVKPFAQEAFYRTEFPLKQNAEAMPIVQQPYDSVIQPGNHWFRGLYWRWGQSYMYTTDRTARSWMWDYELWTFPVQIKGESDGDVRQVILKNDGAIIYNSGDKSYRSLTLLLPQNETGKPYELWVNGRGPVLFDAGLQPVVPGNPKDIPIQVDASIPGAGPAITVKTVTSPGTFPHQSDWDADVQELNKTLPAAPQPDPAPATIDRHVGVNVPRSPETVNFVYLSHGMSSGGFNHSEHKATASAYQDIGTAADYAAYVADTGYDRVYELTSFAGAADAKSPEQLASELLQRGVQLGIVPRTEQDTINPTSTNLTFFSTYLADFHAPLYREVQLGLQRLGRFPNISGISLGADNAGYAQYWDWAPPNPNRPWGQAFGAFQQAAGQALTTPLAPSLKGMYSPKTHEFFAASSKPFLDYVARYNETYKNYGYFAKAVAEVNRDYTTTTGSFGSSPGVGGRGGWVWATIPGKEMHERLPVQTAYDWNEKKSSKPLHLVALLDRLRSYYPNKTAWALQDDFSLFFGKQDREKAYALALTRGIQAIGTNVLPNDRGSLAKPQIIADQKELYSWIHKYGGAYAMTEPTPSIGIMYVNEQALLRGIVDKEQPGDARLLKGSHEGKVTEALFVAHAAGWPAKVITPEELKRGLPSSMKAIMLVGLNHFDDSWHWYDGITNELQQFVDGGGRILKDDESVSPITSAATGMAFRAYVVQSDTDQTNLLLTRNAGNIAKLRTAMTGIEAPIAKSGEPTIWAVPTRSGDTRYVTVVNQKHDAAAGNTQRLIGQPGSLDWYTDRPIYDIRKGVKISQAEASQVDLRDNGFQWYALPPAEVVAPEIKVTAGSSGFYEGYAVISNPKPMTGIPLQWTVTHQASGVTATVYSATGLSAKLPLSRNDAPGAYVVRAKELLSGLEKSVTVNVAPAAASSGSGVTLAQSTDIRRFAERTDVPLVVALTESQRNDPAITAQANRLVRYYTQQGRNATIGLAEPGGVVTSLQEYRPSAKFPQWKTVESDLVLLGTTSTNVLLLDQARGGLLPERGAELPTGAAAVRLVNSPFVGEYHALNIIATGVAGLAKAVNAIIRVPAAPPEAPAHLTTTQVTDASVGLAWTPGGSKPVQYAIERRTGASGVWSRLGTTGGTAYRDDGLQPDTFYAFRIVALGGTDGETAGEPIYVITKSKGGVTTPDNTPPTVPPNVTVSEVTDTSVRLAWGPSTDNFGTVSYNVYEGNRQVNGAALPDREFQPAGLAPDTVYTFTVKAVDAAGNSSAASVPLTVRTMPGRSGWVATASHNPSVAPRALDGSPATRWDTATAQVYGQYYQVDLRSELSFDGIVLDAGRSAYDYPRQYVVYLSADGVQWGSAAASGKGSAVTTIALPSATARYIRIVQTGTAGNFWSIHEFQLYRNRIR